MIQHSIKTFQKYKSLMSLTTLALLGQCLYVAAGPELVIETRTGNILEEKDANQAWYPASLTKLMTTYVTLKAINDGKLNANDMVIMSAKAAKAPPSKMGFRPGTKFTINTAIKILMVKSANDVAYALAEKVAGNAENFANLMNKEARRLGMSQSHFVNPHGLPNPNQQTSARDMAILAMALLQEFPDYQHYFSIPALKYGKRIMRNHNGLMGRFEGASGMKTGFICASGFNVVARTKRNEIDVITVILGATSSKERTERAAEITEKAIATYGKARSGSIYNLIPDNSTPPPDIRDWACNKNNKNYRTDLEASLDTIESYEFAYTSPLQDLRRQSKSNTSISYLNHMSTNSQIEEIFAIEPPKAPQKAKGKTSKKKKK